MFDFNTEDVDTSLEMKGELTAAIHTIKKTSTKESSKPMIVAEFKIFGDKYAGVIMKNNYVVDGPTSTGTKLFFNLVDILKIDRKSLNSESGLAQFIGKEVILKVGKKKPEDQYSSILSVLEYKSQAKKAEF